MDLGKCLLENFFLFLAFWGNIFHLGMFTSHVILAFFLPNMTFFGKTQFPLSKRASFSQFAGKIGKSFSIKILG